MGHFDRKWDASTKDTLMQKHINGTGHIKTKPGKQNSGLFFYITV